MHAIYHDLFIQASTDRVFNALTQAEELDKWWTLHSAGIPALGEIYNFYFSPEYDWQAVIVECKAPEYIKWHMTIAEEDWLKTDISFRLLAQKGGTLLRFEHSNWKAINDHYRKTAYCWALYLRCLKNYIESSIVVKYGERTA